MPLREAHAHLASLGESLALTSLAACGSVEECLGLVRKAAESGVPFIRMTSARVEAWSDPRWPTLAELSAASPRTPVVILSFDHHAAAANQVALGAAGLRAGVPVPPNGIVKADPRTGEPTGLLLEHAAFAAWGAAPEPSPEARVGHVAAALAHLAGLGYNEVHDLHSQDWLGPTLAALGRRGRLPLRVLLYPPATRLEILAAGRGAWESREVRLAGGKLFADGTLNSRTALMLEDYTHPVEGAPRGRAMIAPGEIEAAVRLSESLGLHLAVHAIGDGAVRMALDAFEAGAGPRGGASSEPGDPGHRIEHAEVIDGADIGRFAALGVACSVQPCHLLTDIEALTRYLPHRLHRVLPLRDLIASGLTPGRTLLFGSDAPIVRADPQDSILAATQRRRPGTPLAAAIGWEQRLTEAEAWAAFGAG